jgi:hypothetical protein
MKKLLVVISSIVLAITGTFWLTATGTVHAASNWKLKVVNVNHHLSATYVPDLKTVDNNQQLDTRVIKSYEQLTAAAKKARGHVGCWLWVSIV